MKLLWVNTREFKCDDGGFTKVTVPWDFVKEIHITTSVITVFTGFKPIPKIEMQTTDRRQKDFLAAYKMFCKTNNVPQRRIDFY